MAIPNQFMNHLNQKNGFHDALDQVLASAFVNAYAVGPLLYSPATNFKIYSKLLNNEWGSPYSLALCLEDSIADSAVAAGERNIISLLKKLYQNRETIPYLPNIFIRVRHADQILKLYHALGNSADILTGFLLSKFSPANSAEAVSHIQKINEVSKNPVYFMPILESRDLISLSRRAAFLEDTRDFLLSCKKYVLNVRVGGNDLCHAFGLRRNVTETIYDIGPVARILNDIVTVFHQDFVISGPVWEYFDDPHHLWEKGLRRELRMDTLNGFIGKTVIHPNQIPVVQSALKVSRHDLEDARHILNASINDSQVAKSSSGTRMNEIKTHTNWAKKQILLAYLYGVRES